MRPHGIIGAMRRTVWGILAALLLVLVSGCSFATKDPDYVPPAPLPPLEQLQQVPVSEQTTLAAGEDVTAFVTGDRNIVCAMTSSRGGHLNLPYEANSYSDAANNKFAVVPVVHCELAAYAKAELDDMADDCAGTGLGYLGGTALLTPDKAVYGSCRSGVLRRIAFSVPLRRRRAEHQHADHVGEHRDKGPPPRVASRRHTSSHPVPVG